jgi:hypothetical protein
MGIMPIVPVCVGGEEEADMVSRQLVARSGTDEEKVTMDKEQARE